MATRKSKTTKTTKPSKTAKISAPPTNNIEPITTSSPQFAQPVPTADDSKFQTKHGSDDAAYAILDKEKQQPRPFPVVKDGKGKEVAEPILTLAEALGPDGETKTATIEKAGQIVFHAAGDTGNTRGPRDEEIVADKMVSDFDEHDDAAVPSFFFHLGDVVYSFGESQYYYDQFYAPYRNYPAPIFALAGNHDGMVAPNIDTPSLQAFLDNFCQAGKDPHITPEAGGLARTAQLQPGVYFTLEAPFVRIVCLYSNCLEDPGVISSQGGTYSYISDAQLTFLETALKRVEKEGFEGALIIALHHPPYVAELTDTGKAAGRHGNSSEALKEIDAACEAAGVWPHAVLSAHAHNYQRFTRTLEERQTPFIVSGNGGHGVSRLSRKGSPAIRVPMTQEGLSNGNDQVVFESYDDQDFGYLRIIADPKQLRIEYHPSSDGDTAKTPDDSVTVDLATHTIVHYQPAT